MLTLRNVVACSCALLCLLAPRRAGAQTWTSTDVGPVAIAGSASQASTGLWTVQGSGADIWGGTDSFQFLHATSDTSSILDVWVEDLQNTSTFAKAGIMVRGSLSANARTAILDVRPNGAIEFMVRSTDGGQMQFIKAQLAQYAVNLRLSWSNGMVTAFVRIDSEDNFLPLASAKLSLPPAPEAGVVVTSHDQSQLATAHFYAPTLTRQAAPGWNSVDVGAVGVAGTASESNGVWTVAGAGGDIWGAADAFHYVYRGTTKDLAHMDVRVDNMQNTHAFAKTGLMIRTTLDPASPAIVLDVTPGGNVEFMCRAAAGGEMQYVGGMSASLPIWLRMSNPGAPDHLEVAPSVSQDGVHWTSLNVPDCSVGREPAYYAGVAVTSHDTTTLNTAHVESLSLLGQSLVMEIGPTGLRGNAAVDFLQPNLPVTIEGAGADIWGSSDSFEFAEVYSSNAASLRMANRVESLNAGNAYAKAGLIFRDGTSANAASVILDTRPDGSIEFMARLCTGCATQFLGGGHVTLPALLILVNNSGHFTASVSQTDSAHATTIGSVDVSMSTPLAGFAVTSHDTSRIATAIIDSVTAP